MMRQHFQRWVFLLPVCRSGLCLVLCTLEFSVSASSILNLLISKDPMQYGNCWRESKRSQRSLHLIRLVGLTQFAWFLLLYLSGSHSPSRRKAACCWPPGEKILFKNIHINHREAVVHSAMFVLGVASFPSDVTDKISCACMRRSLYCYSEQRN